MPPSIFSMGSNFFIAGLRLLFLSVRGIFLYLSHLRQFFISVGRLVNMNRAAIAVGIKEMVILTGKLNDVLNKRANAIGRKIIA